MEIVKLIYWILIIGVGCGLIMIVLLFVAALMMTFYKVFLKSKKADKNLYN